MQLSCKIPSLTSVLCQDLDVLAYVISLVDWPKHVKSFFFLLEIVQSLEVILLINSLYFAIVKTQGYNSFFRGSQLHFYTNKMETCRRGKASAIPSADDKQAKSQGPADLRFDERLDMLLEACGKLLLAKHDEIFTDFRKELTGKRL